MSNDTNISQNNNAIDIATNVGVASIRAVTTAKNADLSPVEKLGGIGAGVGGLVGATAGGAVGAAAGFVWQHKGKVAIAAAAVVGFIYHEEIMNFVTGAASGESAGGDAFM